MHTINCSYSVILWFLRKSQFSVWSGNRTQVKAGWWNRFFSQHCPLILVVACNRTWGLYQKSECEALHAFWSRTDVPFSFLLGQTPLSPWASSLEVSWGPCVHDELVLWATHLAFHWEVLVTSNWDVIFFLSQWHNLWWGCLPRLWAGVMPYLLDACWVVRESLGIEVCFSGVRCDYYPLCLLMS